MANTNFTRASNSPVDGPTPRPVEGQTEAEALLDALDWRECEGETVSMALRKHSIDAATLASVARAAHALAAARQETREAISDAATEIIRAEDAEGELDEIAQALGLEEEYYNEDDCTYWLPAEPGPIACDSVAEAVREFLRLTTNDEERLRAELHAARQEVERKDKVLRDCRTALESLPIDTLGEGRDGEMVWPLRDELIDAINRALTHTHGE
jgi:hypothetical protein